jgi:hypothetical protein
LSVSMLGCRSTQPEAYMLNLDQFMNIRFLQKQGHGVREIARLTGHSRNTVRKLLSAKHPPTPLPRVRPGGPAQALPYRALAGARPLGGATHRGDQDSRIYWFGQNRALVFSSTARGHPSQLPSDRAFRDPTRRAGSVRLGRGRSLSVTQRHRRAGLRLRHSTWLLTLPLRRIHPLHGGSHLDSVSSKRLRVFRRLASVVNDDLIPAATTI